CALPIWSIALLYAAMVGYPLGVIGVGLFVSSLARTQQQAILYSFMFMVPAMLLSGFASPVEHMPDWLQTLTVANPVRHLRVIVNRLFLKALPPPEVALRLRPLGVIAVVTLTACSW